MFDCRSTRGLTLLEMVLAMAILAILASAVIPIAEVTGKRSKEIALRQSLRSVRTAIDEYKQDFEEAKKQKKITPSINETGYPEDFDVLVSGDDWGGLYPYKRKYLRRIPKDPFDVYDEGWGKRSYADDPDTTVWGGGDVFDIFSQNESVALDGTTYNAW